VELSLVDTEIINAFQRIPWDAQLWFPVVQRKFLNIGADATDEQIHAAFVSLIEKQVVINPCLPDSSKIPAKNDAFDSGSRRGTSHEWVDEISMEPLGVSRESAMKESPTEITYLESEVILAIENEGWFPGLWFPIVDREALNFGIWRFIKN